MKYPESWTDLKAELENAGVPADIVQGAMIGWALAERSAPKRLQVMATDRTDFITYRATVESSAAGAVETLARWRRAKKPANS